MDIYRHMASGLLVLVARASKRFEIPAMLSTEGPTTVEATDYLMLGSGGHWKVVTPEELTAYERVAG